MRVVCLCFLALAPVVHAAGPDAHLTVQADKPGAQISRLLYGIFFEEINRAGDGGLYAEMLQNRSFEDGPTPLGWTLGNPNSFPLQSALESDLPTMFLTPAGR